MIQLPSCQLVTDEGSKQWKDNLPHSSYLIPTAGHRVPNPRLPSYCSVTQLIPSMQREEWEDEDEREERLFVMMMRELTSLHPNPTDRREGVHLELEYHLCT